MTTRYYLSADGKQISNALGEDHADIGRRILEAAGITPLDYADIYDQMEILGYFRVVEFPERVFAENSRRPVTASQMEFLQNRRNTTGQERQLLINDQLFSETRRGGNLTYETLNEERK